MDFTALVEEMHTRLFMVHNPVLEKSRRGHVDVAFGAMGEYSALIMSITTLLGSVAAVAKRRGWNRIQSELLRNIEEEQGSQSGGVPHCVIIAEQFRDLGLPWPDGNLPGIAGYDPAQPAPTLQDMGVYRVCTQRFIGALSAAVAGEDPTFSVGIVLALETTAAPELQFVARTINEILARSGGELIPEAVITGGRKELRRFDKFSLNGFFAHHIHVWEEGHQAGLEHAISHTDGLDRTQLARGFHHVLDLMDEWWKALAEDN